MVVELDRVCSVSVPSCCSVFVLVHVPCRALLFNDGQVKASFGCLVWFFFLFFFFSLLSHQLEVLANDRVYSMVPT
ncbi:unnamed protein product [Camellia sinensis]